MITSYILRNTVVFFFGRFHAFFFKQINLFAGLVIGKSTSSYILICLVHKERIYSIIIIYIKRVDTNNITINAITNNSIVAIIYVTRNLNFFFFFRKLIDSQEEMKTAQRLLVKSIEIVNITAEVNEQKYKVAK